MSYEISDDVTTFLEKAVEENERNRRPIMVAGAEVFAKALEENTPRSARTTNWRRAGDNVAISNLRTDRETSEKYISVGYKKGVSHRIHVTEFGSMYQRPQGFITKTHRENINKAYQAMRSKASELM